VIEIKGGGNVRRSVSLRHTDLLLPVVHWPDILAGVSQALQSLKCCLNPKVLIGLAAGGDDCIRKPFSPDVAVARIRAVLRRTARAETAAVQTVDDDGGSVLRLADLELDNDRYEVRRGDRIIDLSPTEFALLRYLLENAGRVVSRMQILAHVWTYEFRGDVRIVERYISFLRKKIDCFDPPLIQTLRGLGYSLRLGPTVISKGTG